MSCQPSNDPKYLKRASPPYPANDCCNMRLEGNDGRLYKSQANKNGVCVWRLVKVLGEKAPKKEPAKKPAIAKPKEKPAKKPAVAKEEWVQEIGTKYNGVNLPGKFLFVTLQPLLIYDGSVVVPNEKIVSKRLVKWYKENMESIADYHKIKLVSVWAHGSRICMMFDQTKPAVSMDTFKSHVKEPDDDGNYPVKILKRVFMVSGTDCHIYMSNK